MSDGVRRRKSAKKGNYKQLEKIQKVKPVTQGSSHSSALSKCFSVTFLTLVVLLAVGVLGYYRAPFTSLPLEDVSIQVKLDGPFTPNNKLTNGIKIPGLPGPESIEEDKKGNLYVSLLDGRIVRIEPSANGQLGAGKVVNITSGFQPNSRKAMKHRNHGRPLGLRLQNDLLYVADANFGIYAVNIYSQEINNLVSIGDVDPPLGFPDDLCLTKSGKIIYFTDMTSTYDYETMAYIILKGLCDSRVFQYNMETKKIRVVMSNLCFGNGIQLSKDEKRLFVTETSHYRIRIIDLTTWKTIRYVDVPAMPDNVRPTGHGTYWVACSTLRTSFYGFMERNPIARQIVAGLLRYDDISKLAQKTYNILLEMDEEGNILQTLHDQKGDLTYGLTQASTLSDGRLALGSYIGDFLAILNNKDIAIDLA